MKSQNFRVVENILVVNFKPRSRAEGKPSKLRVIDSAGLLEQAKKQYGAALEAQETGDCRRRTQQRPYPGETFARTSARRQNGGEITGGN